MGCFVSRSRLAWTYPFQHGNSALHEAAWNGYSRTLEVLVKNKARVNIVNKAGFTPLHLSAQNGHNQSARVLLYASCNPDAKNNVSLTSVSSANLWLLSMYHRILTKSSLVVENNQSKYLLNILLKCSSLCQVRSMLPRLMFPFFQYGDTALHTAARYGHAGVTRILISGRCNLAEANKVRQRYISIQVLYWVLSTRLQ